MEACGVLSLSACGWCKEIKVGATLLSRPTETDLKYCDVCNQIRNHKEQKQGMDGGAAKARRLAKASHFLFGYFSSLKYEGMSKDTYFKIEERSWAWGPGGLEAWKGIGEHRTCSPLL